MPLGGLRIVGQEEMGMGTPDGSKNGDNHFKLAFLNLGPRLNACQENLVL